MTLPIWAQKRIEYLEEAAIDEMAKSRREAARLKAEVDMLNERLRCYSAANEALIELLQLGGRSSPGLEMELARHARGIEGGCHDHAPNAPTLNAPSKLRHSCLTPLWEWAPRGSV